jgi:ABC-2 type transport system permease protein
MLRDLGSFAGYVFSELTIVLAAIGAMLLLAERFDGIGPWGQAHISFLLGYAVMVNGAVDTFFGYNVAFISRRIGRGQLDHILMQPQPLWLTLLTEGFSPAAGLPVFLSGALLLVWACARLPLALSVEWVALFALNLVASGLILLAFSYAVGSVAFWAPRAAEEINISSSRLIGQLRTFPLDGVGRRLLGGLLTVVPAGFIAWYPSRALLGLEPAPLAPYLTPVASLAFAGGALLIFRTGLRHYARTGSQRYLSYGHRR